MNFKKIHIGNLIKQRVQDKNIEFLRICTFFNCTSNEILAMYQAENLYSDIILKWCKLLEYDFFRIYSQHLILYAPVAGDKNKNDSNSTSSLPSFRKNIYTKEIIEFILDLIRDQKKTKLQILEEYNIPKSTLHKWMQKYDNGDDMNVVK